MFKKLSLYTLLLCLVPFFAWIAAFRWQGNGQLTEADYWLYLLTETGSFPYEAITSVIFALLFAFLFKTRKQWALGVVFMAVFVLGSQVVKQGLKATFAEPRPFTIYLAEQTGGTTEAFYALERQARAKLVEQYFTHQADTPAWLEKHYENETGYSFPSGHSIFAATWLLLAVGFVELLGNRSMGAKLLIAGLAIWSGLMLISRIRLGMHYPIDLFIAIVVSWILSLGLFGFLQKKRYFIRK